MVAMVGPFATHSRSKGWMQSRFATDDATQPPYFPEMFSEGARFAFTSLIQRLSKWDGSSLDNDLNKLLTPALYSRFKAKHEELDAQGLMMEFQLEADLATPDVGEVWLTFGPASMVRSTVMGGTVVKWFNPLGFVRQLPNKKDSYLFREVVFEFALDGEDMPGGPKVAPAMPLRAQAIKQGQIVGVDVTIDTKLRITVREKTNPTVIVSEKFVDRPVALRFDSSHFTEKMDGEWRVADIDRLLQHELTVHAEAQLRDGRA
ncbi:hypothetical protein HDU85_006357 [Gaertneriomyces sp. JEL0708]|nr:hypothetical protein HDU85_006357 [Gaertneriomyces sp. JEL0708]